MNCIHPLLYLLICNEHYKPNIYNFTSCNFRTRCKLYSNLNAEHTFKKSNKYIKRTRKHKHSCRFGVCARQLSVVLRVITNIDGPGRHRSSGGERTLRLRFQSVGRHQAAAAHAVPVLSSCLLAHIRSPHADAPSSHDRYTRINNIHAYSTQVCRRIRNNVPQE